MDAAPHPHPRPQQRALEALAGAGVESTHRVVRVPSVQDGDSLRVETEQTHELVLSDDFTTTVTQRNRDPRGLPLRLVRLDTPEMRSPDPVERFEARVARLDVLRWVEQHAGRMMVTTYGRDALNRHLADVWVEGGESLSEYMLLLGWDPWVD